MDLERSATSPRDFWFDEATDHAMEIEHSFVWRAMLDKVDVDLAGARVLDVGCSMGGFLRLLVDAADIREGFGFDPAARPIAIAEDRRGDRPLTFAVSDRLPDGWGEFDVAFSHEVLFILHDLEAHARDVWQGLRPGGIYYAVMGTHDRNPSVVAWHQSVSENLSLPPIYSLEQVIETFTRAGFETYVGRIRSPYVPTALLDGEDLYTVLDYYDRDKVMFRFVRQ